MGYATITMWCFMKNIVCFIIKRIKFCFFCKICNNHISTIIVSSHVLPSSLVFPIRQWSRTSSTPAACLSPQPWKTCVSGAMPLITTTTTSLISDTWKTHVFIHICRGPAGTYIGRVAILQNSPYSTKTSNFVPLLTYTIYNACFSLTAHSTLNAI